jgi:DNA-directed RNA polymerase specialized sigma24 family protein
VITPDVLDAWPEVARRVASRLRTAGANAADAEDLAAEAILRAVAKGVTFETPDHLYAWTLHVARNLLVDQRRALARGPAFFALDDLDAVTTADTATSGVLLRRQMFTASVRSTAGKSERCSACGRRIAWGMMLRFPFSLREKVARSAG